MILTERENKKLTELLNNSMISACEIMSQMVGYEIEMSIPSVILLNLSKNVRLHLKDEMEDGNLSSVTLPFSGKINGYAKLIFPSSATFDLVTLFKGSNPNSDYF